MSQVDSVSTPENIITTPQSHSGHPPHRILVTKCSSSPPRSRSQSAGSAHKEALLFFERHQLFSGKEDKDLLLLPGSCSSSPYKTGGEDEEKLLIRKRSARGRSHSQPSQVLLSTSPTSVVKHGGSDTGASGSGDISDVFSGSKGRETKCSSWLEQIQFTVQYQHYRSNDYASVVNSVSSLDKEGLGGSKINRDPPRNKETSRATGSSQSPHLKSRVGPHPLCFPFPKVKLPRIFNTKSLDDILGVSTTKKGSRPRKFLSSVTSSSSPHPTNLEIDVDLDSVSSLGITTPGITNTTGGTATEGFTTTSGYFSDLDRRESCDLLVVDDYDDADAEGHRRRHSSLVSYYSQQGGRVEERKHSQLSEGGVSTQSGVVGKGEFTDSKSTKTRKWSGSSLQKSTSSLTSAFLLRIPPFSLTSDKKRSPKSKESKFMKKKPSKSLSSGSLNKVSALSLPKTCANPLPRAKNSTTSTNSNPGANKEKLTTKSDTYLNRIFSSAAECSSSSTNGKSGKKPKTKPIKDKRRSSSVVSEISSTSTTTGDPQNPATQRKWTAVKHKWDLKLQLPAENSELPEESQSQQRLLFIKSQIGNLVEAQARQKSLDLEASSSSQSSGLATVRPHEPGRVSFRLEPEEIPDSALKTSSSYNTTSPSNTSGADSPVIENKEEPQLSRTSSGDGDLEEMTKSSNPHHFHYASNSNLKKKIKRNANQSQGEVDNVPIPRETKGPKNNGKAHLVVANLSFLQRPISPCLLAPSPIPTPSSTPIPSPGAFESKSSKGSKTELGKTRNLNEARLIGENINVGSATGSGCGMSCLGRVKDVVEEGANVSLQGDDYCSSNNRGDTRVCGAKSGTSFQKSQPQFGLDGDSNFSRNRFNPDIPYLSSKSTVDPSGRGTRFLQEEDEEDVVDIDVNKMGDLQSPTYVKRTAHMFNSIYSSQNGSSPPVGESHNPSYLNVSKSVSGYSCLSYNNTANSSTTTNGTSHATNGTSKPSSTTRLSNGASSSLSSSSPYSHRFVNGSGKVSSENRAEFRIRVNQSEAEVGSKSKPSRDLALSPTRSIPDHTQDEPDSSSSYVPSHGKSFIMQRIERLYGSEAVTASSGIMSKKTINPSGVGGTVTTIKFESVHHTHSASRTGKEHIIPISVENNKENKAELVSKDSDIARRSQSSPTRVERVFRGDEILVGNNDDDNPTPESDMRSIGRQSSRGGTSSLEPCPGTHKLETILLDDQERKPLIECETKYETNGDQPLLPDDKSFIQPLIRTKVNIQDKKDGNYFLQEMFNTVQELQRLCDKSRPELEELDQQSERAGNILAAIGKSQLLIKKKFKQFEELCNANLQGVVTDEPETTDEDLAGFWDMVMIQVGQVYASFKDIEENNSDDVSDSLPKPSSPRKTSSTIKTKPVPSKSQTSAAAKARDESRRKLLAEKRRQMKDQTSDQGTGTKAQEDVVIFTPENN